MSFQPKTYQSVHDFLDDFFEGKNPSKEEIKEAKKMYWRAYNTRLKREQRRKKKVISFSVTPSEEKEITNMLLPQQKIGQYVKQLVLQEINSTKSSRVDLGLLASIEQQQFQLIEYLETLLFQSKTWDKRSLRLLEKQLINLQKSFQKYFP